MKILNFMKNNIGHIIMLAMIALVSLASLYLSSKYLAGGRYTTDIVDGKESAGHELKQGDIIIQKTSGIRGELCSLGFSFNSHDEESFDNVFVVNVYDTYGNLLTTGDMKVEGNMQDTFVYCEFPEKIRLNSQDEVVIEILVKQVSQKKQLDINICKDTYDGSATYNGKKIRGGIFIKSVCTNKDAFGAVSISVFVLLSILMIAVYVMLFILKVNKIENIYLCAAAILGAVFLLIFPEYQTPDEITHIRTAYNLSDIFMGDHNGDNIEMRVSDFETTVNVTTFDRNTFTDYYNSMMNDNNVSSETTLIGDTPLNTRKYQYFLSALGITVGRLFRFGPALTFFLGSLLNYLMFMIVTYYSIKMIPYGKAAMMLISILPMTMMLTSSYSYDCFILTFSNLLVAVWLKILVEDETVSRKYWIILGIAAVLFAPVKNGAYSFLCGLLLILIIKYFKKNRKIAIYLGCVLGTAFLWLIIPLIISNITGANADLMNGYVYMSNDPGYTISYLLANPKDIIIIAWDTIATMFTNYLYTMIGGALGWLNIPIMWPVVIVLLVCVLLSGIKKKEDGMDEIRPWMKWSIAAMLGCCAASVFAALLLDHTPLTTTVIQGVQGRYFLPILLLFLLITRGDWLKTSKNTEKIAIFLSIMMQPIIAYQVLTFMM